MKIYRLLLLMLLGIPSFAQTHTFPATDTQNNFTGINTGTAAWTLGQLNGTYNAAMCGTSTAPSWCSGSDLGAWITAAFASCHDSNNISIFCEVIVPAKTNGGYLYSTTINIPMPTTNNPQALTLHFMPGAYVQYSGTGDAIAAIMTNQVATSNIRIVGYGAKLIGTGKLGNGIHAQAFSGMHVLGLYIQNFANALFLDGLNSADFDEMELWSNHVGVRCGSGTYQATLFGCNLINFDGGRIIGNDTWGVFDDATNQAATTGNFHNVFKGTDIEGNGAPTSTVNISTCSLNTGIVTLTTSTNINGLVNGAVRIAGSATGNGTFKILTAPAANQITYANGTNCTNASGTAQLYTGNVFLEGGDSYLFNGNWFENPTGTMLSDILLGTTNQVSNHQDFVFDTIGDSNATSFIDDVNGANTYVQGLRVTTNQSVTNLVNQSAASTGLAIWEPRGTITNLCAGTCTNATISMMKSPSAGLGIGGPTASGAINGDFTASRSATSGTIYFGYDGNCQFNRQSVGSIFAIPSGCGSTWQLSASALNTALINSATQNTFRVTGDFTTSGAVTTLQNITGLQFQLPAIAANYSFDCHIAYSQATNVADAFGIQAVSAAPNNIYATGLVQTNASTAYTGGTLATLSTTTATNILTFTPTSASIQTADLHGMIENPASANTINIMVSQSTAADVIVIKRGSWCRVY